MASKLDLLERPRRNRKNETIRSMIRETTVGPQHFIYPLFIHEGDDDIPIGAMPGCSRLSPKGLVQEVELARKDGVNAIVLFPAVADELKTDDAAEAFNDDGLIPRTIRNLKDRFPDLVVVTDVALDPYSAAGQDGLVSDDGRILNDETVEVLCKQALSQARAGADIISPSDMMDGRVGAIRRALDGEGFTEVSILSYTAKYASAYYGPFREALDSAPRGGDKKTYQMDPANSDEALHECALDLQEGADMIMVKPGMPYLDIVRRVKDELAAPTYVYQVSGEYAMHCAAFEKGWLEKDAVIMESLLCIKRAGADGILTYFAKDAARLINHAER